MTEEPGKIKDQIRQFVAEDLALPKGVTGLADDALLTKKGVIDSLGIFRLVSFLEATFRVRISDEEINFDNFRSIDSIDRFVVEKIGSKG